jgi:hypothetical protein
MLQFVQNMAYLLNIWPPDDPVIRKIQEILSRYADEFVPLSGNMEYRIYIHYGMTIMDPTASTRLSGL